MCLFAGAGYVGSFIIKPRPEPRKASPHASLREGNAPEKQALLDASGDAPQVRELQSSCYGCVEGGGGYYRSLNNYLHHFEGSLL